MADTTGVRIRFFGAAGEVTGSRFLMETPGGRVLVDCGMFQGRREESRERNARLPRELIGADAVVLTHAHIDHSGSLPTLVKHGFQGSIHTTHATRDVASFMLRDSGHVQAMDAEYLNRKFADDPDHVPLTPIYDEDDAVEALTHFVGVAYHRPFEPVPGCRATFFDAGHILGSAQVLFEIDVGGGAKRRVLFSGDLGRPGLPFLRDPEAPPGHLDALVMESTYGARLHPDVSTMHDDLERVVKQTFARGGKVIVPSFALGRTQELLRVLGDLYRSGRLPEVPIFLDSPLATQVTGVFRTHPDCFDRETRALLDADHELFEFPGVTFVATREASMALNERPGPAIIIAASGMAESGRVLHHLKYAVEDPKNTVLIVGFMAQNTLGRRLLERRPRVRIFGMEYDLRAQVSVLNAFSAHADRTTLSWYAKAARARTTFLVHGEPDQQEPLRDELYAAGLSVVIPARGDEHEVG